MLTAMLLTVAAWAAPPEMIPEEAAIDLVGRTAPIFEAETLEGEAFKLDDERGTPVVLTFWASWCGPCRLELPALSTLQRERDDVVIYAVNVDRDRKLAERFLSGVDVDLPVVWDHEATSMGQYNVLSMPTMFLIDAQGTVKWRKTGFSRERGLSELVAALDGLK